MNLLDLDIQHVSSLMEMVNNLTVRTMPPYRDGGETTNPDPRRDIDEECGWPKYPTSNLFQDLYDRFSIAARVVKVLPFESFKIQGYAYETEESITTDYEASLEEVSDQLRGERSWFKSPESSPLWAAMRMADVICGIGSYGVAYYGIDDGREPHEPAQGIEIEGSQQVEWSETKEEFKEVKPREQTRNRNKRRSYKITRNADLGKGQTPLLYIRNFSEAKAQVIRWEINKNSPRFGMPTEYLLDYTENDNSYVGLNAGQPTGTIRAHWTRCVHLVDHWHHPKGGSVVAAVPRMFPCMTHILDLRKLYGASAEMYWLGAFFGLAFETHPQLGGDVEIDQTEMEDAIQQYMNRLSRYLTGRGGAWKPLAPTVVAANEQIDKQIEGISIAIGCPVPVFKGYEIGEQASENNDSMWADRLEERNNTHAVPSIIAPMHDKLIFLGCVAQPKQFNIWMPEAGSAKDLDKATIAATRIQAMAAYVSGQVETLVPPQYILEEEFGYDADQIEQMLEEAAVLEEEMLAEQEALADEQGFKPEAPEGFVDPEMEELKAKQGGGGGGGPPGFGGGGGGAAIGKSPNNPGKQKKPGGLLKKGPTPPRVRNELADNEFCATGAGGGVDPTCPSDGSDGGDSTAGKVAKAVGGAAWRAATHFPKLYFKNLAIKIDDTFGKAVTSVFGADARKEAAGIAWGIFSRATLGTGPLAVKVAKTAPKVVKGLAALFKETRNPTGNLTENRDKIEEFFDGLSEQDLQELLDWMKENEGG